MRPWWSCFILLVPNSLAISSLCLREFNSVHGTDGGVLSLQEEMSMCEDGVVDLSLHVVTADSNSNSSQSVAPQMLLGLCVPNSCSQIDVQEILEDFAFKRQLKMTILRHRVLPRRYSFYSDPVFYAVVIVVIVALALVTSGTLYDCLSYRKMAAYSENTTYLHSDQENSVNNNDLNLKNTQLDTIFNDVALGGSERERSGDVTAINLQPITVCNETISRYNLVSDVLIAFSLRTNLVKIGGLDKGPDTLTVLHGLRVISLIWIIMVHTCLVVFQVAENKSFRKEAEGDFLYQTLGNGTYSVDTFFFISGLLVSFVFFKTTFKFRCHNSSRKKTFCSQINQFVTMLFYRYFRLTPPYLFVLGIVAVSMKWFKDHGVLEVPSLDYENCPKYWWRNMLYINTFYSLKERCMAWSWYLSNDTQFYILGTLLLMLGTRHIRVALGALIAFIVSAWGTTAFITVKSNHIPSIEEPFARYEELYDKPWVRIGPYLIGMCVGWILFKTKCIIHFSKIVVVTGWIVSVTCMLSIVYGLYFSRLGVATAAAYVALSHSAWAVALGWIVVACSTGHGGWANDILSWKYLFPFSRITYCTYLIHPQIMRSAILNMDSLIHITRDITTLLFLGFVLSSYFLGFLISVLFEAPVVSFLRIVHPLHLQQRNRT